ncbi:hypothetical protein CJF42_25255, partial [Pseudoalteromonas sp. NBT06-2]
KCVFDRRTFSVYHTKRNLIIYIKVFDKMRKKEYFIKIKNHDRRKKSVFKHGINPPYKLLRPREEI